MRKSLLFAALLFVGCGAAVPQQQPIRTLRTGGLSVVDVLPDPQNGVVCYVYRGYNIHCVKV